MAPQAAPSLVHFICRTRFLLHPSVAMKNSDDECPGGAVAMENANVATAVRDLFMLNDDDWWHTSICAYLIYFIFPLYKISHISYSLSKENEYYF